jgi:uncharacterized protein
VNSSVGPEELAGDDLQFFHDQDGQSFQLRSKGRVVSTIEYELDDGTFVLFHTETAADQQRRGRGGALVQRTLDYLRSGEHKMVPSCSFVADWVRAHPEYLDVTAAAEHQGRGD